MDFEKIAEGNAKVSTKINNVSLDGKVERLLIFIGNFNFFFKLSIMKMY